MGLWWGWHCDLTLHPVAKEERELFVGGFLLSNFLQNAVPVPLSQPAAGAGTAPLGPGCPRGDRGSAGTGAEPSPAAATRGRARTGNGPVRLKINISCNVM